jgi:inner membrane protein
MDNLCHTLVGAALGEAGLKRRTALGMATLMIGANFPDIDVAAVPLGHSLEFRRGWTHGVPALIVLPWVLTGLVLLWDRWVRRRGDRAALPAARPRQVLLLAYLSVLTHPLLDWMNTYGMRWLMPLDGTWFYGDALFIIDPWMWTALLAGVLAARRGSPRPARLALAGITAYGALMLASGWAGRRHVPDRLAAEGVAGEVAMVGPVPVNPFRRSVVVDAGDAYRFGTLRWTPGPRLELEPFALSKNLADPAALAAAATPEGRAFLTWSRFPFFVVQRQDGGATVRMDDARYSAGPGASFASTTVRVPLRAADGTDPRPAR